MDILGQSALLVAVTSFGFGCSVLTRNVRNKLFIAFSILTTLVSGWALAFFLNKVWPGGSFYRLHLLLNIWIAPAGLVFIRLMVRIQGRLSRVLQQAAWVAASVLTGWLTIHPDPGPVQLQLIYFLPAVIVLQILQLMWIDRRLRSGGKRPPKLPTVGLARRNLIYFGGLVVLSSSVMDHVPWIGPVPPILGNLALTVYLYFLAQAITQQRLLNFGAVVSRFFVLLVIALTLTAIYSMLFAWIQTSFGLFFLNSFIVSFLLVTLLEPIRSLVGYFTERLLTQKHLRLQTSLREAQRRLTGIIDPASLFQAVLLTAQGALEPRWAALYVLRPDGTGYERIRTIGDEPPRAGTGGHPLPGASDDEPLREILVNHPLLRACEYLERRGELPILLDQQLESELDRSASRVQREAIASMIEGMRALRSNLMIPFLDDGKALGFLALFVPAPPEPWGSNWGLLPIIYPYFEQAARTLRNLDVFARQREKERLAALGEMAAGLAHEIRNPLGAIKGAAQFLDPSGDRPESRFLGIIVEETDRLNRVVTQFLDYSKPPTTDLQPVSVTELVEKTIERMQPGIPPSVRLEVLPAENSVAEGLPKVMANPEQLRQVIINLVQNGVNALAGRPDARIRIGVRARTPEQPSGGGRTGARAGSGLGSVARGAGLRGDGGYRVPGLRAATASARTGDARADAATRREVLITVEDNGPGIRKENLEKLFIPFFTTTPSGTGLGLSISQKIVEAHRGRIEVATEEGRFTRFSVVLPGMEAPSR